MKTIKECMCELQSFSKDDQRSSREREVENFYGKKIKYLWLNKTGDCVDFFSKKEALEYFKEKKADGDL